MTPGFPEIVADRDIGERREVDHREDDKRPNGTRFTGTFAIADGSDCRLIRPVTVDGNHWGMMSS
jgi:hypothetical protein